MKHITFWLDFISPYAYLAFEQLPLALEGISHTVEYRPVLFAGLLKANGQRGPAEIPSKRNWTYRQIAWNAHTSGVPLDLPAVHPFNPLALLRLAIAASPDGTPNRFVCESIFRHVWTGGNDAADPQRIEKLTQLIAPARDPAGAEVKDTLKRQTDDAIAQGVFGVPTMRVDGRDFWGFDSLAMMRAALLSDPWFDGSAWQDALKPGQQQRPL